MSKPTIPRTCEQCTKPFLATKQQVEMGRGRFCGHPCAAENRRLPIDVRFFQHVLKTSTCWLWTGSLVPGGYGNTRDGNSLHVMAHRLAWEIATGERPDTLTDVAHTCDVRRCVRNDEIGFYGVNGVLCPRRGHLYLATHQQNVTDAVEKGRVQHGANHYRASLSDEKVRELRALYTGKPGEQRTLARQFGITHSAVWALVHNKNRKDA